LLAAKATMRLDELIRFARERAVGADGIGQMRPKLINNISVSSW
jgi:hypothetical protein